MNGKSWSESSSLKGSYEETSRYGGLEERICGSGGFWVCSGRL